MKRRLFLAAGASVLAAPAAARFPKTVPDGLTFFVGNSFTRQHDVPGLVCRIADHAGAEILCHRQTADGAHLFQSIDVARRYSQDRGSVLPATVVLQDHSVAPLTPQGRARSAEAMAVYAAQFQRTVLFQTWPRRHGHPLYTKPGMPTSPAEMLALVDAHYVAQAQALGATLAPVGRAWMRASAEGIDVFAADGYHANAGGAWLAALILADALEIPNVFATPPPGDVSSQTAERVAEIAQQSAVLRPASPLASD